jgi:selenocysteine lyase/cysteine desulfurase
MVHPATISSSYRNHTDAKDTSSTYQAEFNWHGTQDHSGYLSVFSGKSSIPSIKSYGKCSIIIVSVALEYRESLGGEEKIQEYCYKLARNGGDIVAKILGTEVMENKEKTLTLQMVNVRLPIKAHDGDGHYLDRFIDDGVYKYKCFVPVYKHHGIWYARLSSQVYLDESDFETAGHSLKSICDDLEKERLGGKK